MIHPKVIYGEAFGENARCYLVGNGMGWGWDGDARGMGF